jgi:hypothetical protein
MKGNNSYKTPSKEQGSSKLIDINSLSQHWSPEERRVECSKEGKLKVRSIQGGHVALRGGDYIANAFGEAATVSFCLYNNDKKYGLTVAHLFRRVGDVVYAFSNDTPAANGKYQISQIGHVVSMDANTDSLVFEIRRWVDIEDLCLAPECGLAGPLKIPDWDSVPPPAKWFDSCWVWGPASWCCWRGFGKLER